MERHGAAHRISTTLPGEVPSPGVRQTRILPRWDTNGWNISSPEGRKVAGRSTEHFDLSTWSGPAGHTAEVEERHGDRRFVAGPYRTQHRAQTAANSLTDRVAGGGGQRYQR
jgi:hypothetical protein